MSVYRKRLTINYLCCKQRFNNTFYKQHRLPNKEFGHAHLAQVKVTNVTIRLYCGLVLLCLV